MPAPKLLAGLVVVELGTRIAAGAAGGLLAMMGAEVILVEPPVPSRSEKWAHRAAMAAGKRSVVIDQSLDSSREGIERLVSVADVLLLSSDLSPEQLSIWRDNAAGRAVVCDITAFGHTGPLAGRGMSEALVQALSGIAETTGRRDGPPSLTGAPFLDMETAAYAVAAILAAVRARRRDGVGQRIDMALYDVAVNALLTFLPLQYEGREATRNGNRHPTLAPWNAYRASDGFVLICAPTNEQWRKLCGLMDLPELVDDDRFRTPTTRFEHIEALDHIIEAWTSGRTVAECVDATGAKGIPSSPIIGLTDLGDETNLVHRNMVHPLIDPVSGMPVQVPGSPIRVRDSEPGAVSAIPLPNADADWVEALVPRTAASRRSAAVDPRPPSLQGLRIIEVGMNTVAPLACRQLGALGADVIKVEPPSGDANRINTPLRASDGQSYVFALSNTDKRGVVLDLREPGARDTLLAMLATADVMIENLKPGSLERLGFSGTDMLQRFPRLVYCSVNGFGHDTSYPGRPALDTVIQGMSGAMDATRVDGVPTKAGISISDQLGGQFGLIGILAALQWRDGSGVGLALDLAMQDCTAWATQTLWNTPDRTSTGCSMIAALDGFVAVEGDDDAARAALAGAGPRLTREQVVARLAGIASCRAASVLTVDEVVHSPQTAARGLLVEVPTADGSNWRVIASPLRLEATPARVRSAMPQLGFVDPALADEFRLLPTVRASVEA